MKRPYRHISLSLLVAVTISCCGLNGQILPSYEIERLSLSSGLFRDIAPVIVEDGMVFSSNRRSSIIRGYQTFEGERLFDIYIAGRDAGGEYGRPRLFSRDLRSLLNEGPLCFSADGNTVYFTRNIEEGRRIRRGSNRNRVGIFIADRVGDSWTNIRPFEHNNPSYNVGHPSLSSDGSRLYFASDMPGGHGGSDIYYSEWKGDRWGEPVNAGREVNTAYSELYPLYHETGRLYFSSDRAPVKDGDYGGLNIYYSYIINGEPVGTIMLNEPLNSPADDFAVALYPSGNEGYFSSSRGRADDIYSFRSVVKRVENCSEQEENSFCFEFWETNAVVSDTLPFEYEWDFGDGNTASGIRVEHCFDGPGSYIIRLDALNIISREVQRNIATYRLVVDYIEQPYITSPDTIVVGERAIFSASETYLPGWEIESWYWNFDDNSAALGEVVTKVFNRPGTYSVQLVVTSIPDSDGLRHEACVTKIVVVIRDP